MDSSFCVEALQKALEHGKPEIFNSDQGSQFTSSDFVGILESQGVKISMDGRGRAYDNIFIERLWRWSSMRKFTSRTMRQWRRHSSKYLSILSSTIKNGHTSLWTIKHRKRCTMLA
jgi:transposase InsO family protein